MKKMLITDVPAGHLIAMLGGLVKVDEVRPMGDNSVTVYVSIGKLKNHPVPMSADTMVDVHTIDPLVGAWYGV